MKNNINDDRNRELFMRGKLNGFGMQGESVWGWLLLTFRGLSPFLSGL